MAAFTGFMAKEFKRPDQNVKSFQDELNLLTAEDKRDLYHGLKRTYPDCDIPMDRATGGTIDVSDNPRNY